MTEIKFRAWDYESRKMFTPASIPNYIPAEGDHIEYLQFTGLLDKKGKEIYEGDIFKNDTGLISKVVYDHETLALLEQQIKDYDDEFKWYVIGNIYENPELLTK